MGAGRAEDICLRSNPRTASLEQIIGLMLRRNKSVRTVPSSLWGKG